MAKQLFKSHLDFEYFKRETFDRRYFRDLARAGLQQSTRSADSGDCVAALVYVYDHASRNLSGRLVENFDGHHDLSLATLHVHLDDHNCMELTALKGPTKDVQHLAIT